MVLLAASTFATQVIPMTQISLLQDMKIRSVGVNGQMAVHTLTSVVTQDWSESACIDRRV